MPAERSRCLPAFHAGAQARLPGTTKGFSVASTPVPTASCSRTRQASPVAVLSAATSPPQETAAPIDVYHSILEATRASGRLQVVMFHADHCRSCKAAKGKFVDLMEGNGDADYALVNLSGDQEAADRLGIANLPTFHFYVAKEGSVGLLDEFQCGGFGCAKRVDRRLAKFSGGNFDIDDYDF